MKRRVFYGFTLVETIFSTLFIGVTVLAIVNLFPGAYLSIRKSEMQLQADMVAKSVLDEVRSLSFAELEPGNPKLTFNDRKIDGVTYSAKVEPYDVPGLDRQHLRGVRVTIDYFNIHDSRGATRKLILETYRHALP